MCAAAYGAWLLELGLYRPAMLFGRHHRVYIQTILGMSSSVSREVARIRTTWLSVGAPHRLSQAHLVTGFGEINFKRGFVHSKWGGGYLGDGHFQIRRASGRPTLQVTATCHGADSIVPTYGRLRPRKKSHAFFPPDGSVRPWRLSGAQWVKAHTALAEGFGST